MFIITCFGSLLYFFLISYIFLSAVNSSTAAVMVFIPFLLPTRASIIKILQIKITRMAIHLAHFGTKKLLTWYISPKLQNRINDHYKHYVSLPNTLPSVLPKSTSLSKSISCQNRCLNIVSLN